MTAEAKPHTAPVSIRGTEGERCLVQRLEMPVAFSAARQPPRHRGGLAHSHTSLPQLQPHLEVFVKLAQPARPFVPPPKRPGFGADCRSARPPARVRLPPPLANHGQ